MAVILSSAPALALSRNQIPFVFDCPDAITTAGVAESIQAKMAYNPAADQILAFAWTWAGVDYTASFTFKAVPDGDLYEIETGTADLIYIDGEIVPGLLSNPDLAQFFKITYN